MRQQYSETQLIRGCANNERKYQEALYRQYFGIMLSMIRRYTRDEEKALEIINNGFLKVFKKIDQFQGKGSFEGWIRRIVYHSMSDFFKKENRYLKFIVLDDPPPVDGQFERNATSNALDELYYEDLIKLVDDLPHKSQQVFRMFAIQGYSHKEIGEVLEISSGTSKWHLSNARSQLKNMIHQRMNQNYAG